MRFGSQTRGLIQRRQLIGSCDRIFHGRELQFQDIGDRQPTVNAGEAEIKRDIAKTEKRRQETVKDAEGRDGLDHGLQRCPTFRSDLVVHKYDRGAIALMRWPGESAKHPEGTPGHQHPLIVPLLNMPGVVPFTEALGGTGFKTARTSPVTATGSQKMPFEMIRGLVSHLRPPSFVGKIWPLTTDAPVSVPR